VRRLLPCAPWIETDLRVKHLHGDPGIPNESPTQPQLREIDDTDLVGPRDRAQSTPPGADKVEQAGLPKSRKEPAYPHVLLVNR
jgi:hypothetical protein